jgi:spermidine/putrescine transport system permease protein
MSLSLRPKQTFNRMFWVMALPPTLFLLWGLFIPILSIFVYSFWRTENFQLIRDFTFDNYIDVLSQPAYFVFLFRSLSVSISVCILCLLIAWPSAYFIAKHGGRFRFLLVLAIAAPFFTGLILRLIAFQAVFGPVGMINMLLAQFGIPPMSFLMFNQAATTLGLVYLYAPFMLMPIYLSLQNFDFDLVEAAKVNGASPTRAFLEVTWPLNWAGTVVGFLIVFVPCLAESATPKFLGGPSGTSLGGTLSHQFGATGTWSLGSAIGVMLFTVSLVVVLALLRTINLRRSGLTVLEE